MHGWLTVVHGVGTDGNGWRMGSSVLPFLRDTTTITTGVGPKGVWHDVSVVQHRSLTSERGCRKFFE